MDAEVENGYNKATYRSRSEAGEAADDSAIPSEGAGVSVISSGVEKSLSVEEAIEKGKDILPSYTDLSAGAWYEDGVAWALGKGIMNGTRLDKLSPKAGATRAQVAAILMRYEVM